MKFFYIIISHLFLAKFANSQITFPKDTDYKDIVAKLFETKYNPSDSTYMWFPNVGESVQFISEHTKDTLFTKIDTVFNYKENNSWKRLILTYYLHQNIINAHLESICKKAKINAEYQYTRTEGGKSVNHKMPKYKFISTHTTRRSFCTNAYYSGIPPHDIMAISGHKTEKIFFNYIKVEIHVNAIRISNHPFF